MGRFNPTASSTALKDEEEKNRDFISLCYIIFCNWRMSPVCIKLIYSHQGCIRCHHQGKISLSLAITSEKNVHHFIQDGIADISNPD